MEEERDPGTRTDRRAAARRRFRRVPRGWLAAAVGVVLAGATAVVLLLRTIGPGTFPQLSLPGAAAPAGESATLYFADPRWTQFVPEERRLPPQDDATARIRALVAALAAGPQGPAAPVLPKNARVRNAYLGADGLAVIDFEPGDDELGGGASAELLTVFSLVHTIARNVPGIQSVQILVGGAERETLAGHVKISEPLRPDPRLEPGTTR